MRNFFRKPAMLLDVRPTAASWPKKIFEWEELPQHFHRFVQEWVNDGMELEQMTYIPRIHKFKVWLPEHMITWHKDKVMLLCERRGEVKRTILDKDNVIVIEYSLQLLNVVVNVIFKQNGQYQKETFQYTRTMEEQLVPNLNLMLGNEPMNGLNVYKNENLDCKGLEAQSYLMFNYSKLAYRMGNSIQHYFWCRMEKKIRKIDKDFPEYFVAMTELGLVLIDSQFYGISAVYLPYCSIKSFELVMEKKSYLEVKTSGEAVYQIPVPMEFIEKAGQFKKCLMEYSEKMQC